MAVAVGVSLAVLLVIPLFVWMTGASASPTPDVWRLLPGLVVQAGIAEEVLFRGYLFGRLRRDRSFRRAAVLAAIPFVAVHLFMFLTMPWQLASAGLLLSVVVSFPLAHLFELGGRTIWAPALLHFVVQGTVKVVTVADDASLAFPLVWIVASAILPLFVFAIPRPRCTVYGAPPAFEDHAGDACTGYWRDN
jgi:membrane protease YdiL (CAAX protease family)